MTLTRFQRGVVILTALFTFMTLTTVRAQTPASIAGTVTDESGGVIANARVVITAGGGTAAAVQSTTTDAAGSFTIGGVRAGLYVVRVESSQFEPYQADFTVADGASPSALRIVLRVRGVREDVTVEASGGFSRPRSTGATRFEADALSVPQSSQTLPSTLLEAQGAVDVGDALKQVPSAFIGHTRLAPFTSFSWRIRGLDAGVTRNGFRQLYFEDVDQSAFMNVDRLEVIKGPGGAVYGKEGLGGVIHMVTKRPGAQLATNAQASLGQWGTRTGAVDVTGPIGSTGIAVRATAEIERSGSFVRFQDLDRSNVSFALTMPAEKRVRGFLNVEYQQRNTLPNPGLPVVGTVTGATRTVSRRTFLGEPEVDYLKTWAPLTQAWVDISLGKGWTLSPRYQHFRFNVDQQQMQLRAPVAGSSTLFQRTGRYDFNERDKTQAFQLELKGKATTGSLSHQLLAGVEINRHSWTGDWFPYASVPAINALNPSYLATAPARASAPTTFSGDMNTAEPYIQDLITIGRLDVLLGARSATVNVDSEFLGFLTPDQNHTGSALQAGAAYRLRPSLSLFAGVSTGFSVDNIVGSTTADGTPFVPERSRQVEAGVKHQSGRLTASAAVFNIVFENATTTDPVDPNFAIQVGEQTSTGVEVETQLRASSRLYVTGGLAFIDATITRSNDGDEGFRLPNVAKVQANLWGRFEIDPRLFAGVGINVVGRRFGTLNNSYALPRYGTVDASLSWQLSPRATVELFGQNLFDQTYFTGGGNTLVYPGEPRTVYVRLRARLSR